MTLRPVHQNDCNTAIVPRESHAGLHSPLFQLLLAGCTSAKKRSFSRLCGHLSTQLTCRTETLNFAFTFLILRRGRSRDNTRSVSRNLAKQLLQRRSFFRQYRELVGEGPSSPSPTPIFPCSTAKVCSPRLLNPAFYPAAKAISKLHSDYLTGVPAPAINGGRAQLYSQGPATTIR